MRKKAESITLDWKFPICLMLIVHVAAQALPCLEHGGAELAGKSRMFNMKSLHMTRHVRLEPKGTLKGQSKENY